jgi:hypothetical protein
LFSVRSEAIWTIARMPWVIVPAFPCAGAARWGLAACALWAATLALPNASAGDKGDHDRARQAVLAGQVLPLPAVLERLQRDVPGQVLEVELELEHDLWIYELKLLTSAGRLTKVKVDARTGEVLRIKSRDDSHTGREKRP